ncbi:hypothetical protein BS47DRAFT_1367478 [Hydnum rufescens UP504]|uniref:Uncharacterized protein n=1 Tax=Hydnum rufescens UP504 TaxID=1448309 RepID=A0A9P6DPF9_9AGAM|nr:hypothetical protein BS47DRAFT_1367478 [Hydnum rufescens UP504]
MGSSKLPILPSFDFLLTTSFIFIIESIASPMRPPRAIATPPTSNQCTPSLEFTQPPPSLCLECASPSVGLMTAHERGIQRTNPWGQQAVHHIPAILPPKNRQGHRLNQNQ